MKEKSLDVYYKGQLVGTLEETSDKLIAFEYSDEWLDAGFSISPISLPLKKQVFVPEEDSRRIFKGLFGVFADSLPDSWGELLLDRTLSSKGISRDDVGTLDRLAYVGSAGMGALEYYPSEVADYSFAGLDYDTIAKECNKILSSKPSDELDLLYKLGGSSGGTRPKILINENGIEWIVKFPSSRDPKICGKREYDYSTYARKCGINMTATQLIPSKICDGYFKTERFDRSYGEKIHSVTFAAMLEVDFRAPSCDYSTYMRLVNYLTKEDKKQLEQMFRIMCFNVYTHNHDDHTKNFSFLWENNKWMLAPAYDLTYSDTYYGEHTTSINGKGKWIEDEDLINVGVEAGLKKYICKEIIEEIKENLPMIEAYLLSDSDEKIGMINLRDKLDDIK